MTTSSFHTNLEIDTEEKGQLLLRLFEEADDRPPEPRMVPNIDELIAKGKRRSYECGLTGFKVFPLRKLIRSLPSEELSAIISTFSCERNKDVESFLKKSAIVHEKRHISRTYLIFADDAPRMIDAYFTIAVSSMDVSGLECSSELRKKMNINNGLAQSYLIGQIGKRDGGEKGLGEFAILSAVDRIMEANEKVGCRVIRLDCKPSLMKYYAENGFSYAGKNKDGDLSQMVRIIDAAVASQ